MIDDVTPLTEESARAAREAAGMTLRVAASLLHIDFTYLSKVENGHERPSDALLLRMGEVYGFDGPATVLARRVAEVPDDVRAAIEQAAARRAFDGLDAGSHRSLERVRAALFGQGYSEDEIDDIWHALCKDADLPGDIERGEVVRSGQHVPSAYHLTCSCGGWDEWDDGCPDWSEHLSSATT